MDSEEDSCDVVGSPVDSDEDDRPSVDVAEYVVN